MTDCTSSSMFANEAVTLKELTDNTMVETPVFRSLIRRNKLLWLESKSSEAVSRASRAALRRASTRSVRKFNHDTASQSQHTTDPPLFTKTEIAKRGGTGQVFQVTIHPSHTEKYSKSTDDRMGKTQRHLFALKEIRNENFDDFSREVTSHQRLARTRHPHIVPLFASYREISQYHLIFPWADCDLAMFWRLIPRPLHDKRTLEWMGHQIMGLADALSVVHGPTGGNKTASFYGVHGDLKPANILYFSDAPQRHTLAITDFGSSYFLPYDEKEKTKPRNIKRTPAYRAPEVDITSEGVTQAYDIWGLGCIISETLLWALDGLKGCESLSEARRDREENSANRDAFFQLQRTLDGVLTARLKPQVLNLLLSMRCHPKSTPFSNDILDLVVNGMLRIDFHQRMTSQEVVGALAKICKRLDEDPAYSEPQVDGKGNDMNMVHTNQNAGQRPQLDRTVDANYYTNTTTQSVDGYSTQDQWKPRFACPFFKAGILISAHHRACERPGWTDINKVKEHLFRTHLLDNHKNKFVCRRCDQGFKTDELLLAHQHQELACHKNTSQPTYGKLTREQTSSLRSLKRKSTRISDEERWFEVYKIVNPCSDPRRDGISPYCESNSVSMRTLDSTSSSGISQYKDYLLQRNAEDYMAKLASQGIPVSLATATKILELQVKEIEDYDGARREPVLTYGITQASCEKVDVAETHDAEIPGELSPLSRLMASWESHEADEDI
ncbi:hypothetical protein ACHAQI_005534 [Fusarium lateritium]